MIFALLTLLTALSLATVAGWFSIVGFMAIYAGAPMAALIMGAVTEAAKLVTISWIYRNWEYTDWKLKAPLIYFSIALMVATSIGVFGFLSKGHLEQGAGTIDNSARIETLNYQINREKSLIADNEKVIGQLDATVNSFLGKDRTDRSLSVRKSQASQRKQLRDDSDAAQKRIDALSTDKFKLESEVRKMQLDVGPIRYIAELFYGVEENATKNIEAAVRIFTLLIVSTLDPLAVILLIAANHTLLRLRNEKEKTIPAREEDKTSKERTDKEDSTSHADMGPSFASKVAKNDGFVQENEKAEVYVPFHEKTLEFLDEEKQITPTFDKKDEVGNGGADESPVSIIRKILSTEPEAASSSEEKAVPVVVVKDSPLLSVRQPKVTRVNFDDTAITPPEVKKVVNSREQGNHDSILREIMGHDQHFVPEKVIKVIEKPKKTYPSVLSWLSEFKRT